MVKLLFWVRVRVRVSVRDRDRTPMFAIALMKLQCPDRGTDSIPLRLGILKNTCFKASFHSSLVAVGCSYMHRVR